MSLQDGMATSKHRHHLHFLFWCSLCSIVFCVFSAAPVKAFSQGGSGALGTVVEGWFNDNKWNHFPLVWSFTETLNRVIWAVLLNSPLQCKEETHLQWEKVLWAKKKTGMKDLWWHHLEVLMLGHCDVLDYLQCMVRCSQQQDLGNFKKVIESFQTSCDKYFCIHCVIWCLQDLFFF